MPQEAINFFDQYDVSAQRFSDVIESHGWERQNFENSILYTKQGNNAVFKVWDPRDMFQEHYFKFIQVLLDDKITPEEFPHLPIIYRARYGVVVLEKLYVTNHNELEKWGDDAANYASYVRSGASKDEMNRRFGEFLKQNPKFKACMDIIFRTEGRVSFYTSAVLQRPDGTPVVFDPIV